MTQLPGKPSPCRLNDESVPCQNERIEKPSAEVPEIKATKATLDQNCDKGGLNRLDPLENSAAARRKATPTGIHVSNG
jgi:hypothetical protein